jgi:maleate cis-trans isomerase
MTKDIVVGVVKPSRRPSKSLDELASLLPADVRIVARYAPVESGALEEFEAVLPAYRSYIQELAAEGAELIHLEGTPAFLLIGWERERGLVAEWQAEIGLPIFTSAMCQARALRALGARTIIDCGYDPTTGPPVERYFAADGFEVLAVEKAPIDWRAKAALSDDAAFSILARFIERFPRAEALCLQGSSKWPLSGVIDRLEQAFGVGVVHPVAARYWELMLRLGRRSPIEGFGRLLREAPSSP